MKKDRARIITAVSLNSLILIAFGYGFWLLTGLGDPAPSADIVDVLAHKQAAVMRAAFIRNLILVLAVLWTGLSIYWRKSRRWVSYLIIALAAFHISGNLYYMGTIGFSTLYFMMWSPYTGWSLDPYSLLCSGILLSPLVISTYLIGTVFRAMNRQDAADLKAGFPINS
jgi:hypothetical protein